MYIPVHLFFGKIVFVIFREEIVMSSIWRLLRRMRNKRGYVTSRVDIRKLKKNDYKFVKL